LQSSCERKGRTLSTNTIISEVDALGLSIDVNNFDLADFITKDDFAENLNACRKKESLQAQAQIKSNTLADVPILLNPPVATIVAKPGVPSSKPGDSDYDSESMSNKQPSVKNTQCTGLGLGGKNLSLLKQERDAALSVCAAKPIAPPTLSTTTPTLTPPAKRKLNLEEYKQRRCGGCVS